MKREEPHCKIVAEKVIKNETKKKLKKKNNNKRKEPMNKNPYTEFASQEVNTSHCTPATKRKQENDFFFFERMDKKTLSQSRMYENDENLSLDNNDLNLMKKKKKESFHQKGTIQSLKENSLLITDKAHHRVCLTFREQIQVSENQIHERGRNSDLYRFNVVISSTDYASIESQNLNRF